MLQYLHLLLTHLYKKYLFDEHSARDIHDDDILMADWLWLNVFVDFVLKGLKRLVLYQRYVTPYQWQKSICRLLAVYLGSLCRDQEAAIEY